MLCTLNTNARVRYAYVTHTLAYVMHTLLIRSHTLCIRYSYARVRYAYVTHTLAYVMHTLLIRSHTLLIRFYDGPSSIARVKHSKVVRISSFFRNFHTLLIRSIIRCSVTAPLPITLWCTYYDVSNNLIISLPDNPPPISLAYPLNSSPIIFRPEQIPFCLYLLR